MMYKDATLEKYLEDLAAKLPAPGGGSAAALTAACGAALMSMVANFTLGKPAYARYQSDLAEILDKSEKLRKEFLRLVDVDVTAYMSRNIKDSLDIPFMVARLCYEGINLCPPLIRKGNVNLISDVASAAALLEAGFACALFNVEINLKALKDRKVASAVRRELSAKEKRIRKIRHDTEVRIGAIIRG